MAERKRDYAGVTEHYTMLLSGFKANAVDFTAYKEEIKKLEEQTKNAVAKNEEQEKAKAAFHQLSEKLNSILKELKQLTSRLESAIYAKYGKKNDKLEEFGLRAWKSGGRKGQRKKQGEV